MIKEKLFRYLLPFFYLLVFTLFFYKGFKTLDPDFGWHLRMGELVLKSGIPKTDPFSYSMPSYPFVDHEWLTDIIIFKLYAAWGKAGLAGLFAFIVLSSLIVGGKQKTNARISNFNLALSILAFGAFFPFTGIRPQVISWLFLAIFLKVILMPKLLEKFFWVLPLLVFFWVNLHGSFALSIFCLGIVIFLRSLQQKKVYWKETICFILCLSATFINPHKFRIWWEVWQQISDSALRFRIAEWQPSFFEPVFPFLVLVAFSYLVFRFRRKFSWEEKGLFTFFLIQSFLSLRNIPLFVIVSCPIYLKAIEYTLDEVKKVKYGEKRFLKMGFWTLIFSAVITGMQVFPAVLSKNKLGERSFYPTSAVEFLKSDLPNGQVFSSYNWGGYLIWKLPEKKVFIDGRMPSWRYKANLKNESNNAMKDYLEILSKEGKLKEAIQKYGITTILWPNTENTKKDIWQGLDEIVYKLLKKDKPLDFVAEVKDLGWKEVYKDETAVIYSVQ